MKVLSILQPWASLVIHGHKKIETRSWNTKYRGPLLIHASAKKPTKEFMRLHSGWVQRFGIPCFDESDYPTGAIIGQVKLIGTTESETVLDMSKAIPLTAAIGFNESEWEQELAFGDYSDGRYGWILSEPVAFQTPTTANGKLSIWEFDESLLIK